MSRRECAVVRRPARPTTAAMSQERRHVGMLEPLWSVLDLTPEGRPADWDEQLNYT